MYKRAFRIAAFAIVMAGPVLFRPPLIGAEKAEFVIVNCARPCAGPIATVSSLGGQVTYVYENVDAIAAMVPAGRVDMLTAAVGADAVHKDVTVALPQPIHRRRRSN
jgi:hypothetical protein